MRVWPLLALALLLAGSSASLAQDNAPPPDGLSPDGAGPGAPPGDENGPPDDSVGDRGGGPPPAMTIDDARVNMFTLVQSFMAERSTDGVWLLKDKAHGGVLRLTLAGSEAKNVRERGAGNFRGVIPMKDAKSGRYFDAEFTVDFGGKEWKVLGMTLKPGKGPKAKRKSKTTAKKRKSEASPAENDAPPGAASSDDGAAAVP